MYSELFLGINRNCVFCTHEWKTAAFSNDGRTRETEKSREMLRMGKFSGKFMLW